LAIIACLFIDDMANFVVILAARGLSLVAMAIGAILYFPIRKWVKKDIPDVDPYVLDAPED